MQTIIYTTKQCEKCQQLKAFLDAKKVVYEEKDLSDPEALTELRFNGVFTLTAPILQLNDEFLTVTELFKENSLDFIRLEKLLKEEI